MTQPNYLATVYKTIGELRARRDQLAAVIAQLETLDKTPAPHGLTTRGQPRKSNRGRKSMAPKEREEVSRRMKAYWLLRRKAKPAPHA